MGCEESFITMKLMWHSYLVSSLGNCAHETSTETGLIEADRKLIGQIREAGMKPAQVYEFMKEFYGGANKVPFSRMDCFSLILVLNVTLFQFKLIPTTSGHQAYSHPSCHNFLLTALICICADNTSSYCKMK